MSFWDTVAGFLSYSRDNAPLLEKIANFFLWGIRYCFDGDSYIYLADGSNNYNFTIYYDLKNFLGRNGHQDYLGYANNPWYFKLLASPALFLAPIGIVLKLIAAVANPDNNKHYLNWQLPQSYYWREPIGPYLIENNLRIKSTLPTIVNFPEKLNQQNLFRTWVRHFLKDPYHYLSVNSFPNQGKFYNLNMFGISECACIDGTHDRIFGNTRKYIERKIIDFIDSRMSEDKKSIKALSFGAGSGLQDFIIVLYLLEKGVNIIDLTLVDSKFNLKNQDKENIEKALEFLQQVYPNSSIKTSKFSSIEDVSRGSNIKPSDFDLVYGVDLDNYKSEFYPSKPDFKKAVTFLNQSGKAFVSSHRKIRTFAYNNFKATRIEKQIVPKSGFTF